MPLKQKPINFLLDVDGVLTSGDFIYNKNGKFGKILDRMTMTL